MEKIVLVLLLALAITLAAVPPSFTQQVDSGAFQGFSLDDIQGLTGSLDQNTKEPADSKQAAAADFQNGQGQVDGLTLDDVKAAADDSFQGAKDNNNDNNESWMEWAKDKLQGLGMIDSTDSAGAAAGPGGAPAPAPGADAEDSLN